ncbi:TPA: flippase [Klebsiella variicola]
MKKTNNNFLHNVSWNLVGFIFPVVTAILVIPFIIKNIGTERFGILTLIYSVIGYMNVFDFGLTRSITKQVVKYKELNKLNELASSILTGLSAIVVIILCVSFFFSLYASEITHKIFNPSTSDIEKEVRDSLYIISFCLPFVVSQSVFSGVMEAFGEFKKIATGKIPFSFLMYAVPFIVSLSSPSLISITISLCILRIVMAIFFYYMMNTTVIRICGFSTIKSAIRMDMGIELVKFGGWVSISNIIAPVMLYIDRFFIASLIGASVVAYYTTPYEVVSKVAIVAASVCGVLFPLLVKKIPSDIKYANKIYWRSFWGIFGILILPVCIGISCAHFILSTWINEQFAEQSKVIFCLFLIGFMIHGLIQPAFTWIQSSGKPQFTAFSHVFDLVLYVIYFPVFVKHYGVVGAAYSWVLRVTISFVVLNTLRYILYKVEVKKNA